MVVATDGRGSLFNTIVTNGLYIVLKVEKYSQWVAIRMWPVLLDSYLMQTQNNIGVS